MTTAYKQPFEEPKLCTNMPPGWQCTLAEDHPGRCVPVPAEAINQLPPQPRPQPQPEPQPEPEPVAPEQVKGESQPSYGFNRPEDHEFDLTLPSGSFVRLRKLGKSSMLRYNLLELFDSFTPELLADLRRGDDGAGEATLKVMSNPETSKKIFGPVARAVVAALVCPKAVHNGPTTSEQINVEDIDMEDQIAIFNAACEDLFAALGEQLKTFKSGVREKSQDGVRDVPESEGVQSAPE